MNALFQKDEGSRSFSTNPLQIKLSLRIQLEFNDCTV